MDVRPNRAADIDVRAQAEMHRIDVLVLTFNSPDQSLELMPTDAFAGQK
jgi:hypothetical protein